MKQKEHIVIVTEKYIRWFGIKDHHIQILKQKYGNNLKWFYFTPQQKLLLNSPGYKWFMLHMFGFNVDTNKFKV